MESKVIDNSIDKAWIHLWKLLQKIFLKHSLAKKNKINSACNTKIKAIEEIAIVMEIKI